MGKVVVIFGGCGFFGTHITRKLAADPTVDRIIQADIRPPREAQAKAEYVVCDVREPINIAVTGEVEIYNFAAVHTTPGHEDWEYFWTNISGATNVCRFAAAVGANKMVFTSTMGIYGPQEERVDESTIPQPVTAYGRSKWLAEHINEDWQAQSAKRRLVIVRPAVTFGEGENGNFERLAKLLKRRLFVYPGRKDTIKSCAPVEELGRTIDFMAAFDEPVVRYIFAYPERTTTETINQSFHDAAGYHIPNVVIPESLTMAAAWVFEMLGKIGLKTAINRARVRKLIHSTNVVPKELIDRGFRFEIGLTEALRRWRAANDFH